MQFSTRVPIQHARLPVCIPPKNKRKECPDCTCCLLTNLEGVFSLSYPISVLPLFSNSQILQILALTWISTKPSVQSHRMVKYSLVPSYFCCLMSENLQIQNRAFPHQKVQKLESQKVRKNYGVSQWKYGRPQGTQANEVGL